MRPGSSQLDEWLARLETLSPVEIELGLERVQQMLGRLDLALPETIFHVAGTNGKGSSVAMLEALLQGKECRVGAYTSPHLLHFNERIRVDGVEVDDARIVAAFESVEALRGDIPLTYFEYTTLAALCIFAAERLDAIILEVGLGGRLDAVNAVEPTACLITNISLDHCEWLGDTVEAIAAEKAGVMRRGKPVVFASPDMPASIKSTADTTGARLLAAKRDYDWLAGEAGWSWQGSALTLQGLARPRLQGALQLQNAAGVLTLLEAAGFGELLTVSRVDAALQQATVAGRLQRVGERWLLDVAHNPGAAAVLAGALKNAAEGPPAAIILGMLNDKDVEGVVEPLNELCGLWIAVTADHGRAIPAAELARRVSNATDRPCRVAASVRAAMETAEAVAAPTGPIVVTGSFYTVGGAMAALGIHA